MKHTFASCAMLAWLLSLSLQAHAQSAEGILTAPQGERLRLLAAAQAALTAGDVEAALRHAEAAGRIEMSPSVRLFLAQRYASLGRTREAHRAATLCVTEASSALELRNREALLRSCTELVSELELQVGRIALQFEGAIPPGVIVEVNGETIPRESLSTPIVVQAGRGVAYSCCGL